MMYISATGITYEVIGDSYRVVGRDLDEWVKDAYLSTFIKLNMKMI